MGFTKKFARIIVGVCFILLGVNSFQHAQKELANFKLKYSLIDKLLQPNLPGILVMC